MIINIREFGGKTPITDDVIDRLDQKLGSGKWYYVGRRNGCLCGSPLANPFEIGKDGDRDQVLIKYHAWLKDQVHDKNPDVLNALRTAKGKHLVCWCYPLGCHATIVRNAIESLFS